MDTSEKYNLKSAFYFICGKTDTFRDADYNVSHNSIQHLIQTIHKRCHEIGLHPSYHTYKDPIAFQKEADALKLVLNQLNITQPHIGGRMHYLRWQQPETLWAWENAKFSYDSTLGYAEAIGFRCGTSFEYQAICPIKKTALQLRIRPLHLMDQTLISGIYMKFHNPDDILQAALNIKNTCQKHNGQFNLLWHNSELNTNFKRAIYENLLSQ